MATRWSNEEGIDFKVTDTDSAKSKRTGRICKLLRLRLGRRDIPVRGLTGQGEDMEKTGRKNAAGAWIRWEFLKRIALAGMLLMTIVGCALGVIVRGLPIFDGPAGSLASWMAAGATILALGVFYAYCRGVDASWGRGLEAERQIGDLIDHAVAQRGCAVAHDVKEALGGQGNVDHVVMTPAGIWVVETKSDWLSKRRFRSALRQVAENVDRVRSHLETSLPVRGALVIADRSNDSLAVRYDWNGETVQAFGAKKFWRVLSVEREETDADVRSPEMARVERAVWNLGSTRYLES
ncbi:MAG: nuclease-related domain-containing protein [Rhodospirillaceae bacterium]|nr:nuclease-related domain-containing protein [Rhodospirillaceae bacterium]